MELRWHESSEAHIARHNVTWDEAVEAIIPPVVTRSGSNPGTRKVLGRTYAGRYLALIVAPDTDSDTAYLITAREMDDREKAVYRRRVRKG